MANYFLTFDIHNDRDKGLDFGRLCLRVIGDTPQETKTVEVWVTTSSIATKQSVEGFHDKGGVIPPDYRLAPKQAYSVSTTPLDLKHVKGVEGSFYVISPFEVKTDKGGVRGDFGIHKDANVPGSLGCPVMTPERFASFEQQMALLSNQGIKTLPLFVTIT